MIEVWNTWKLAITKCALVAFTSGASAFITSMAGIQWETMTGTEKAIVIIGISMAMANTVVAFLDRTMSRIAAGKTPNGGDTQFVPKPKGP